MTKTEAIRVAKSRVSQVMRFGGGYVFHHDYDGKGVRISNPQPYAQARAARRVAVFGEAAAVYVKGLGQPADDQTEAEMLAAAIAIDKPWLSIHAVLDKVA